MLELSLIVGATVLCCSVFLVFNCVCHIFRRRGFSSFENDAEVGDVSMYQANDRNTADISNITFEPLPDILAKTVSSRALRPRITNLDKENQAGAAKLVTIYKAFPRSQLLYIKEIGLGWFGQVLQGDADRIVSGNRKTRVVVKILKDDASPAEQRLFLEEVAPYRELHHENILQLLGQCTETAPFLNIMEFPSMGDLKCYLIANKKGPVAKFILEAAIGLSFMHSHGYVHHDFSARNCLLTSDYQLKIGDYGIAEDVYREDYYDTGQDLLPVRWMSPESLQTSKGVWQLTSFTVQSNIWSLGVMMWETVEYGGKPYSELRDEEVLQKVVHVSEVRLTQPTSDLPLIDRWYEVMEMCWQETDDRPSADDIVSFIKQIQLESSHLDSSKFDSKWDQSKLSQPHVVQVGQNGTDSPQQKFESDFVASNNQSNSHVTEVMVHRVEDVIGKVSFEDDFVHRSQDLNSSKDTSQNDSILAYGGIPFEAEDSLEQERMAHIMLPDSHLDNLSPVPMGMSTPTKGNNSKVHVTTTPNTERSDAFRSALSNQETQSTQYLTAADTTMHLSVSNVTDETLNDTRDEKQSTRDEGYRTDTEWSPDLNKSNLSDSSSSSFPGTKPHRLELPSDQPIEYEEAKEIYMSKGATLTPSFMHSSRSLGTIPEDGIPSDNTSQSGVTFEEQMNEDNGMSFEWDDYIGEELVGRVKYTGNEESPSQVEEFNEWPFDQDSRSSSEASHSKPNSIASDVGLPSDVEVNQPSKGRDTRAYIANLLTNRLSSLSNPTNTTTCSDQSYFYSFSQNVELDYPEHSSSDSESVKSMLCGMEEEDEKSCDTVKTQQQPQEDIHSETNHLIGSVVVTETRTTTADRKPVDDSAEVIICEPHAQMLQTTPGTETDVI